MAILPLDAPAKRAVALRLVEQGWTAPGDTAISVQVLQEMHVNLGKRGVSQAEARRAPNCTTAPARWRIGVWQWPLA